MAHGGARTNTGPKTNIPRPRGRPVGSKTRPKTIEKSNLAFDLKAYEVLPMLFDTVYDIAKGFKVAVYEKPRKEAATEMLDDKGDPIWVYSVPPDKTAAFYLIDRAAGRAAVKNPEVTDTELTLEVVMQVSDG